MRSTIGSNQVRLWFEQFARNAARWAGSSLAFVLALLAIVIWAATGPYYRYSDTWQLIVNTATTVVTFLMVFLIQQQQNKDSLAIQLKLNEIVAALSGASNRLICVEDLSEDEVRDLHDRYQKLAAKAQQGNSVCRSRSIEDIAEDTVVAESQLASPPR